MRDANANAPHSLRKICAIGGGTMGPGTALCFAMGGHEVGLWVRNPEQRREAMEYTRGFLDDFVGEGLLEDEEADAIFKRITPTSSLAEAATGAGAIMESVSEDAAPKRSVIGEAQLYCLPDAFYYSNTSSLDPDTIFSVLPPEKRKYAANVHFFLPSPLMTVVEVIPGSDTSEETINVTMSMLKNMHKKPVLVQKPTPGFVVNYVQFAIYWKALELHVKEKISAAEIDTAFKATVGVRYEEQGPLALAGYDLDLLDDVAAAEKLKGKMPDSGLVPNSIGHILQSTAVRAALELVANGVATARSVDEAIQHSIGRRLAITGPLESGDLTGLKVAQSILRRQGHLDDVAPTPTSQFLAKLIADGRVGLHDHCLAGVYDWTPESARDLGQARRVRLFEHLHADAEERGRPEDVDYAAGEPRPRTAMPV